MLPRGALHSSRTEFKVKEDTLSQHTPTATLEKKAMVLILGGRLITVLLLGSGIDFYPK